MFRHMIPSTSFTGVMCETKAERDALLQAFRAEGITEVNGIPIDKFVRVGTTV